MARRKQMKDPMEVGMQFEREMVARIDRIADIAGLSRSQIIRNLVELGLDEAEALQALGLLSLGRFVVDMKDRMQERRLIATGPSTA